MLVAFYDLGPLNNVMMLTIACVKALFVILYFMHVRWSSRLTWVVVASGFFWLLIMFTFTMTRLPEPGLARGAGTLALRRLKSRCDGSTATGGTPRSAPVAVVASRQLPPAGRNGTDRHQPCTLEPFTDSPATIHRSPALPGCRLRI